MAFLNVAAALLFVLLLGACGGGGGSTSPEPAVTLPASPEALDLPPSAPSVLGIFNDFLVIEGSELFPAIPPCSAFEATEDAGVASPLTIGEVPAGAVEARSDVSVCPDGAILSASKEFTFPEDPSGHLLVFYARAPYSFPILLADRTAHKIEAVEVNGRRGVVLVPTRLQEVYSIAALAFWVEDQQDQRAGAYVQVSLNANAPNVAEQLKQIAESISVTLP